MVQSTEFIILSTEKQCKYNKMAHHVTMTENNAKSLARIQTFLFSCTISL